MLAGWLSPFRRVGCLYLHNIPPNVHHGFFRKKAPNVSSPPAPFRMLFACSPHARCPLTQAVTPYVPQNTPRVRTQTLKITLKSLPCDSLVLQRSFFYNLIFRYEDELAVSLTGAVGTLKGNTAPKLFHPSPPPHKNQTNLINLLVNCS